MMCVLRLHSLCPPTTTLACCLEFGVRIELTWRVLQTLASATRPSEHKLAERVGIEPTLPYQGSTV